VIVDHIVASSSLPAYPKNFLPVVLAASTRDLGSCSVGSSPTGETSFNGSLVQWKEYRATNAVMVCSIHPGPSSFNQ
jgi:hypothetical protein